VTSLNECAAELREIAGRLRRTASLRRRNPDAWLEERDELAHAVVGVAEQLERSHRSGRSTPA
jgi:hypothetical protein